MDIPNKLALKIRRVFGATGDDWLMIASGIVKRAIALWSLSDVSLSPVLSHNLVCFARSTEYGNVVLKVGVPHPELFREMAALRAYAGRHACKIYDCRDDLGALLLERIEPGQDLWQVTEHEERVSIAAELAFRLPIPAHLSSEIPCHATVLQRAFTRTRAGGHSGHGIMNLVAAAEELMGVVYTASRSPMLLHGDLNHWNILRSSTEDWKAIDPQGFIGPRFLECGRFILNEIIDLDRRQIKNLLPPMIATFAQVMREDQLNIWRAAFLDAVLSTCWHYEDNSDHEKCLRQTKVCEIILEVAGGLC